MTGGKIVTKEVFVSRVEEMIPVLYRVCRAHFSLPQDREDAVQEALVRAWEKRDTLRDERYFDTWLMRVVINESKTLLRRRRRVLPMAQPPELRAAEPPGADVALYEALFRRMDGAFPEGTVKVQKSQISFYGRHLFAAASLPVRRRKDWPKMCLMVTVGLPYRLDSPRVVAASEPYPGRWTHHVLVTEADQIDEELMGWLREAWNFAESKR